MKRNISLILVLVCLSISCTSTHTDNKIEDSSNTTVNTNTEEESAIQTNVMNEKINFIQSFYKEYITETCLEDDLPEWEKIEKIQEKYCSKELRRKIKEIIQEDGLLDADPFLNAQDCDIEWLKSLNVKADVNDSWFVVSYSYTDYLNTKQNIEIRLKVISANDSYYIDDIEGL